MRLDHEERELATRVQRIRIKGTDTSINRSYRLYSRSVLNKDEYF